MKKSLRILSALVLLVFGTTSIAADSLDRILLKMGDELAAGYLESRESLYSRRSVTITGIENASPLAKDNYVGEAVEERLKRVLHDSLVFRFVDRKSLGAALEEMSFQLSGLTDDEDQVSMGRIDNVHLLISGSVTEAGEDFLLTLQLVDVETTALAAVSSARLPKRELIREGNIFAFQNIVKSGIGLAWFMAPHPSMMVPATPYNRGEDGTIHADSWGGRLVYRLSRNIRFSLGYEHMSHQIYTSSETFEEMQNVPVGGKENAYDLPIIEQGVVGPDDADTVKAMNPYLHLNQKSHTLSFTAALVIPFSPVFNVAIGGGPTFTPVSYHQSYDALPVNINGNVGQTRFEIVSTFIGFGYTLQAEAEFFVLPRLALNINAAYSHPFMMKPAKWGAHSPSSGEYYYTRDDRSQTAFGLDPFMLPDGRELSYDLFSPAYFRVMAGFSLYF